MIGTSMASLENYTSHRRLRGCSNTFADFGISWRDFAVCILIRLTNSTLSQVLSEYFIAYALEQDSKCIFSYGVHAKTNLRTYKSEDPNRKTHFLSHPLFILSI